MKKHVHTWPQELVALPISGEAFLLRRGEVSVLVDSGWNGKTLASLLDRHVEFIDIAVCTHADSDHAKGFTTLLDEWKPDGKAEPAPIGQFWLPGAWSDAVRGLMQNPRNFVDIVLKEMESFIRQNPNLTENPDIDLKSQIDLIFLRSMDRSRDVDETDAEEGIDLSDDIEIDYESLDSENVREPDWMMDLRRDIEKIARDDIEFIKAIRWIRRQIHSRIRSDSAIRGGGEYWLDLIDTAKMVGQIARSAIRHKVKIRWFDYDETEKKWWELGGVRGLLVPVNAAQLNPPPPDDLEVAEDVDDVEAVEEVEEVEVVDSLMKSRLLRLSAMNKQCLSFYSPGRKRRPPQICDLSGVLFCGDSPMAYAPQYSKPFKLPRQRKLPFVVVTAPHHGSESNARAYDHIRNQYGLSQVLWVRNGGNKPEHPGPTYRKIPSELRICTWCPRRGEKRKKIEVGVILCCCLFTQFMFFPRKKCNC